MKSSELFLLSTPACRMGARWQRIRSILNPRMLKPKHVSSYSNTINDVVTDFISRVAWLRDTGGQGHMVNDLTGELYKFAFEGEQGVNKWCCFVELTMKRVVFLI